MVNRRRWIGLIFLIGLLLAATDGWAQCGACQVCRERTRITIPADFCAPANNEAGSLCCQETAIPSGTLCTEYGEDCYGIIVNGGGGGGGSDGGTTCAYQSGWCPAECMSCSSGGRPAI
jgi:hypothetical protein